MDAEERFEFENALRTDLNLQADLAYYQNVHSSLKMKLCTDVNDREFQDSLSEISKNYF